jgi:8-amino-7-oxononanoate synthase
VVGGFCVTDLEPLRRLKIMARPYLYTAALPPSVVAAARASLGLIARDTELKKKLWGNTEHLRSRLKDVGIAISGSGPIGSISLPRKSGYELWSRLLSKGVYASMLITPATPDGELALRLSLSAAHEPAHIERAIDAFGYVLGSSTHAA